MNYYIGIDIGTSSVRTLITDEQGKIKALASKEYPIYIPKENFAEQEPEYWWNSTVETIRKTLSKLDNINNIKAIGLSGQMHGLVAMGKNNNKYFTIRKSIIWCDGRTSEEIEYINSKVGKEKIIEITHGPIAAGFQTASILWIKKNEPDIYENIYKIILPKDYIRFKLTGEIATDITDAASTGILDANNGKWSDYIINKLEIEKSIYPNIYYPNEIAGYITEEASKETGLPKNIKVMYGGADQAMQALGNGILEQGTASITIGTGGQILMPINQPIYDKKMSSHTFNFVEPNTWYYLGAALSSGLSLKWAKNNIAPNESFKLIDKNAKNIKVGSNNLIFLPYLAGERTPHMDIYAKGMLLGLTLNHNKYHIFRAIMEGVVFSLKDAFSILTVDMGINCNKLIASGGGSHSKLWLQIQADILNKEIYVSNMKEQSAFGASIVASVGNKTFLNYKEAINQLININDKPISPIKNNVERYKKYYDIFKLSYLQNKNLMHELSLL